MRVNGSRPCLFHLIFTTELIWVSSLLLYTILVDKKIWFSAVMQHVVSTLGAVYFTELYFNTVVLYSYCALGCRCKATDICAREPLLDAVETSALMVPAAAVPSSVYCYRCVCASTFAMELAATRDGCSDAVRPADYCSLPGLFSLLHSVCVENVVPHAKSESQTRLKSVSIFVFLF